MAQPLDDKQETQKQWDRDPCGAVTASEASPGTLAFYRSVRNFRYGVYAPWFDKTVRFSEWAGSRILEIGPGLGSDHFRFAEHGNEMHALDLSRGHLGHLRKHFELESLGTKPVLGDAETLPYREGSFDLVYSFGVLHHTPDTEGTIREVYRVLRPGGTALIGLYHRNSVFFWLATILVRGVLKGGLIRKGYRRLLSEIEYRSDENDALPLVRVFSRTQSLRMFAGFSRVTIDVVHGQPMPRLRRLLPIPDSIWENYLGWYLIIRALK